MWAQHASGAGDTVKRLAQESDAQVKHILQSVAANKSKVTFEPLRNSLLLIISCESNIKPARGALLARQLRAKPRGVAARVFVFPTYSQMRQCELAYIVIDIIYSHFHWNSSKLLSSWFWAFYTSFEVSRSALVSLQSIQHLFCEHPQGIPGYASNLFLDATAGGRHTEQLRDDSEQGEW